MDDTITDTTTPTLTDTQIADAVRNDYPDDSFALGHGDERRVFPIKDLSYDSYIEFLKLARPVMDLLIGSLDVAMDEKGEPTLTIRRESLDLDVLLDVAGTSLPRLAHLCCKQSDPRITVDEVKRLARRPMDLLDVVIKQVQHNKIVQEFADFFPRLVTSLSQLAPESTIGAIPSSS